MTNVSLGCDPEFLLINEQGKTVPAYIWLPKTGQLGNDGPLAEVRPNPAWHEDQVVSNISTLLGALQSILTLKNKFGKVRPMAFSEWENYAVGFHIHLGIPKQLLDFEVPGSFEFIQNLIYCLDYFVGLPSLLLEDTNVRRLGNGPYGKVGDFRLTPKTVEYRTPGGFYLRHPAYARGLLGLALCVAENMVRNGEKIGWERINNFVDYRIWQAKYSLPPRNKIQAAFADPTKSIALKEAANIYRSLAEMPEFAAHQKNITSFFSLLLQNKQFSPDLLQNWTEGPAAELNWAGSPA